VREFFNITGNSLTVDEFGMTLSGQDKERGNKHDSPEEKF
jgi:hypothetical protein